MKKYGTELTHLGTRIDLGSQAIPKVAPIVLSGAYVFETPEDLEAANRNEITGYSYGRDGSLTNDCARDLLTALDGGAIAEVFASGMAAIGCTLMSLLRTGDHMIMSSVVFGTTYNMILWQLSERYGIEVDIVDMIHENVEDYFKTNTKLVFLESISNPMVAVVDLESISAKAHRHGAKVVVDNTFATPIVCRPLDLGADIVVYSATKFMNGHSDIICGAVVLKDPRDFPALADQRRIFGAIMSPLEAFLFTRSLRTLEVRMHVHCANAMELARFLSMEKGLPVDYSGLEASPFHALAKRQFNEGLFGGMLSLDLGTYEKAMFVARQFKLVQLVPSLGCLTTTISDTRTSHSSMSSEERKSSGIGDGVLRISVGLENSKDIIADFDQALSSAN